MFRDGTDIHTDRHTHGHGDSMTNSAQWGRVGENPNLCNMLSINVCKGCVSATCRNINIGGPKLSAVTYGNCVIPICTFTV